MGALRSGPVSREPWPPRAAAWLAVLPEGVSFKSAAARTFKLPNPVYFLP